MCTQLKDQIIPWSRDGVQMRVGEPQNHSDPGNNSRWSQLAVLGNRSIFCQLDQVGICYGTTRSSTFMALPGSSFPLNHVAIDPSNTMLQQVPQPHASHPINLAANPPSCQRGATCYALHTCLVSCVSSSRLQAAPPVSIQTKTNQGLPAGPKTVLQSRCPPHHQSDSRMMGSGPARWGERHV